ncbi:hypothetical protein H8356DRAFT_1357065 [Neocallimastix lanati (nom. inval.)]|nr:hypothetical protein H8356DRAFT_1357065 [Neocallimastix sp. JGI-2020a]
MLACFIFFNNENSIIAVESLLFFDSIAIILLLSNYNINNTNEESRTSKFDQINYVAIFIISFTKTIFAENQFKLSLIKYQYINIGFILNIAKNYHQNIQLNDIVEINEGESAESECN